MMKILKKIFRAFASNAIAIYLTSMFITSFEVKKDIETISLAAAILILVSFFVKPLIKTISFPINVITLGFFELIINTLLLYIVIFLVQGINVTSGVLDFGYFGFIISEITLSKFGTVFASSLTISIINWILKLLLF